jgi:uncharacterized protein
VKSTAMRLSLVLCSLSVCLTMLAVGCTTAPGEDSKAARGLPVSVRAIGTVDWTGSGRYRFDSDHVGKPFVIEVVRVDAFLDEFGSHAPDARLPVVFVLDNLQFSKLVPAIVRAAPGLFPSMLVVGIGYDHSEATNVHEVLVQAGVRRSEDFTPSFDAAWLARAREQAARAGWPWPEEVALGGANAFLSFINEELKPFLAAHYSAQVEDAALIGHSLGGLFTLHVLFTSPESFSRYIALSPASEYDHDILFREEAALGDVSARLFIGLGGEDVPEIVERTPPLDAQIRARARPGLRYRYKVFPDEDHMSVIPAGVMTGLRAIFDPPTPPTPGR